jgi:hypothetical protein
MLTWPQRYSLANLYGAGLKQQFRIESRAAASFSSGFGRSPAAQKGESSR